MEAKIKTILLEFKISSSDHMTFQKQIISKLKARAGIDQLEMIYQNDHCSRVLYANDSAILNVTFLPRPEDQYSTCTINLELTSTSWPSCNSELQALHDDLRSLSEDHQSPNFIPIITRGTAGLISPYLTTSDDRLVEYGFQKVLFDQTSAYQRVQIVQTADHGNLLILDGAVNLAENDTTAYTHSLMNIPEVSILGLDLLSN